VRSRLLFLGSSLATKFLRRVSALMESRVSERMDTGPVAMGVVHVPGGPFCDCHMETRREWVFTYPQSGMECGADLWEFAKVPGPFRGNGAA
jgi:hypothetical protein